MNNEVDERAEAHPEPPGPDPGPDPADRTPAARAQSWRDSVPFDETGVLIRPAQWSADRIETELVEVGALRANRGGAGARSAPRTPLLHRIGARHGILSAILLLQSLLSLRNRNTAFEDEALYLYSGHLELNHLVQGAPLQGGFSTYFTGAPVLYPILGALADQIGGVGAARLLNLFFMLGTTALLYATARRLFDTRTALCAAGLFSTTEAAVFLGGFATYDAPSFFLFALAAWIVVRSADSPWPFYLLAAFPATLGAATEYASVLYVPTVAALAALAAWPRHGRWALIRGGALGVVIATMILGALQLAGPTAVHGILHSTTGRARGDTTASAVLLDAAQWGGILFGMALMGAVLYARRPATAGPGLAYELGRVPRAALALLLAGGALITPVYQIHLRTDVSFQKHIGFGLWFAAPLAGYGLVRLSGRHFSRIQAAIGVWALALAAGMGQTHVMFNAWADSGGLVAALRHYQTPAGRYLVEVDEVPIYYLRGDVEAEPDQFTSTYSIQYTDAGGHLLSGAPAYQAAIKEGYFQIVAIEDGPTRQADEAITAALAAPGSPYRRAELIPGRTAYGTVVYQVWVRK